MNVVYVYLVSLLQLRLFQVTYHKVAKFRYTNIQFSSP